MKEKKDKPLHEKKISELGYCSCGNTHGNDPTKIELSRLKRWALAVVKENNAYCEKMDRFWDNEKNKRCPNCNCGPYQFFMDDESKLLKELFEISDEDIEAEANLNV